MPVSTTLHFQAVLTVEGLLRDRAVRVEAGRVAALEPTRGPFDGWLALPGMPNAHSHAFQRALAGRGERARGGDSFWSWREEMYGLAARLTPESLHAIAAMAFAEMLRGGFTRVAEFHYVHRGGGAGPAEMAGALSRAARDVGIRLGLLPVYYRTSDFDTPARPEQAPFLHGSVDEFLAAVEEMPDVIGVAPHSLRAVPAEDLANLVEGASAGLGEGSPIHMHIAEQPAEVERCRETRGTTPIRWLADAVELGPRWQLVHATHAEPAERRLLRDRNAGVVLCPLTEAYLGDGLFEARDFVHSGGRIALGSDANTRLDAAQELRMLEYGQRLKDGKRGRLADEAGLSGLWTRSADAGASAMGVSARPLEVGAPADLVVLDPAAPALAGHDLETAVDAWLIGGGRQEIRDVYVEGRRVVHTGGLENFDRIRASFDAAVRSLFAE